MFKPQTLCHATPDKIFLVFEQQSIVYSEAFQMLWDLMMIALYKFTAEPRAGERSVRIRQLS